MPDFIIHAAYSCESNADWKKKVGDYLVTFGPSNGSYGYDWACTCKGFKFRRACKHIESVKKERCAWNAECDPGVQPAQKDGQECCPRCSGDVVIVKVAV